MSDERAKQIDDARRHQPMEELRRKQQKAFTRHYWTQEDIDLADAEADEIMKRFAEAGGDA